MYAVLYLPAPASKVLPAEINIKALAAVAKSPFPLLRDTQIGDTGTTACSHFSWPIPYFDSVPRDAFIP
jgi:hypothetical protein